MPIDIKGLFAKGGAALVEKLGTAIDSTFTNAEEKAEAKLKLEQEINRHMEALMLDATKQIELENQDRDSARKMQTAALAQSDLFSKRFMYFLAGFVIVSAVVYGIALLFVEVPDGNKRMVEQYSDMFILTGALMVLSFFFGAAHRSADTKHAK